jgi:toxin HigB-1
MIRSFKDRRAAAIVDRRHPGKGFPGDLLGVARRKLVQLDAAEALDDLRRPPGNRLERLTGDPAGQYSIRINDQWRLCFRWTPNGPEDVEIVDYH